MTRIWTKIELESEESGCMCLKVRTIEHKLPKGTEFFHKLKFSNPICLCNLVAYTFDFANLDYIRSIKLGCKDIVSRKYEFVAKT